MRIGIFGDIHANLISLDAVLAQLSRDHPNQLVCLGDLAITGPHPHQVVSRLRELGCPVVRGNWDDLALEVRDGRQSYQDCRPVDRWCAEQLTTADLAFLTGLPLTLEVPLPSGIPLLCYHGSPRNYHEGITAQTPDEELDLLIEGRRTGILVGGHTHIAMLRRHWEALILNPGSIGENWRYLGYPETEMMMFNHHANYALVDDTSAGVRVTFGQVPIDVDAVIRAAYDSGMPDPEPWTALWQPE